MSNAEHQAPSGRDDSPTSKTRALASSKNSSWAIRLLSIVIVGYFVWFMYAGRDKFSASLEIEPSRLVALTATIVATWILGALRERAIYRCLSVDVPTIPLLRITLSAALLNYLPLRAGTLAKAEILKRTYGLRYARFAIAFVSHTALGAFSVGVVGFIVTLVVVRENEATKTVLLAAYAACAGFPLIAMRVPTKLFGGQHRIVHILNDMGRGWEQLCKSPGMLLVTVLLSVGSLIMGALRLYVAFKCIGLSVGWGPALILATSLQVGMWLTVTPGALGLREGLIGITAGVLNFSIEDGVFAATIDRGITMLLTFALGAPSFVFEMRKRKMRLKGSDQ